MMTRHSHCYDILIVSNLEEFEVVVYTPYIQICQILNN